MLFLFLLNNLNNLYQVQESLITVHTHQKQYGIKQLK